MPNRRKFISTMAICSTSVALPISSQVYIKKVKYEFKYCLNTSTISGQKPGLKGYIEIASKAGYDGVELWESDVKAYLDNGNSTASLKQFIADKGLTAESAIGFAPWLKDKAGMDQMCEEMNLMKSIGCKRIAAPARGIRAKDILDFEVAGEKY